MKSLRLTDALRVALVITVSCASLNGFAQDKTAERNLRRMQLQMQALHDQLQEAQAAKAKVDDEKAALAKQLSGQAAEIPKAQGAARKAAEGLKAVIAERADLAARLAATEAQLAEQKEQKRQADEALVAKGAELTQALARRDAAQSQLQLRYDEQVKEVGDCAAKNGRLVQLGAELLDRYRRKGVVEAMKQREPVLGLGDVEMFNLVQDYRDKTDAERYVRNPVGNPAGSTPR